MVDNGGYSNNFAQAGKLQESQKTEKNGNVKKTFYSSLHQKHYNEIGKLNFKYY